MTRGRFVFLHPLFHGSRAESRPSNGPASPFTFIERATAQMSFNAGRGTPLPPKGVRTSSSRNMPIIDPVSVFGCTPTFYPIVVHGG